MKTKHFIWLILLCMVTSFILEINYGKRKSPVIDAAREIIPTSLMDENEGFVQLPASAMDDPNTVSIYVPKGTDPEKVNRAQRMMNELAKKRIPFKKKEEFDLKLSGDSNSFASRKILAIMQGDAPIVAVKGWIKANPTNDQVMDRYRKF